MDSTYHFQMCVKITVYNEQLADEVVYYQYKLPTAIIFKWRWYFEYLAARIKVKNPQRKVELIIVPQDLLAGQEYVEEKTKNLLRKKRSQIKALGKPIQDDLFGFHSEETKAKIERLNGEIADLENGVFNYYVPETYINKVKKWI